MPTDRSQGQQANRNGRTAENVIDAILRLHASAPPIRQYPVGFGIYGTPLQADFYLADVRGFVAGLIIESKWQESSGSVDEKWPYLVENIRHCYPAPTIIVLHGGGFRPGAERWLRTQVDSHRLFAVLRLEEFMKWCSHNL